LIFANIAHFSPFVCGSNRRAAAVAIVLGFTTLVSVPAVKLGIPVRSVAAWRYPTPNDNSCAAHYYWSDSQSSNPMSGQSL